MGYAEFFNKTFDKIYVITLERATERHVHFKAILEGIHYTIFYGKDKLEFTIEDLEKQGVYDEKKARKNHRFNKPMPPGMIGCAWSHQLVYADIVKNGYHHCLILEDDIVIDEKYTHLLPEIFEELPTDWELFYFGFAGNEKPPTNGKAKQLFYHLLRGFNAIRFTHRQISHLYPKKISPHIYEAGYHDCTHAYAVSLSGAKKLLALQTPVSYFPDSLLAYACTEKIVKAYFTLPKIINQLSQLNQGDSYSYINQ